MLNNNHTNNNQNSCGQHFVRKMNRMSLPPEFLPIAGKISRLAEWSIFNHLFSLLLERTNFLTGSTHFYKGGRPPLKHFLGFSL